LPFFYIQTTQNIILNNLGRLEAETPVIGICITAINTSHGRCFHTIEIEGPKGDFYELDI